MRRAAKIDNGQREIVSYLRSIGWSVHVTAPLGEGFPDLIVAMPGYTALVEVKDGTLSPSRRKLTRDQYLFRKRWQGDYVLALSPEDAAGQLAALRQAQAVKHIARRITFDDTYDTNERGGDE